MSRRIVIASPSHATRGGVESIIHDLCRALPSRGWNPTLALAQGATFNNVDLYRKQQPDLPIVAVDGTKGTKQARVESLGRLIEDLRPDILLSFRLFDAYQAAALAKQRHSNLRLAIAIRGYEPHYLFDARIYRKNVDLCVVDGELIAAAARELSEVPSERVVSIPGGIRAPNTVVQSKMASEPIRLGYVGRLAQSDKRVLDLVDLVERMVSQDVHFLLRIVGTGPEEAVLRTLLAPFVERGMVNFLNWMTTDQLYSEIYPNLDCLLHFSPAEGVTISPREAMAHGVVPVISEFIGLKSERMFKHGANSLVFPVGNIQVAAAHVQTLANQPELWSHLSANARESQIGKYSADGAMDLWAQTINRCADSPALLGPPPNIPMGDEGRLGRLGFSPWWAQRTRDAFGARSIATDPGSEWPTGSGLMTPNDATSIMHFAKELEGRNLA